MKFDFSKYDKKWRWFAVDLNRDAFLYTDKPKLCRGRWEKVVGTAIIVAADFDSRDWENSLQEREEEEMEKLVSVFEMEEGKEYTYKNGAHTRYRVVNGLLQYICEHSGWIGSDMTYNLAVRMMFKEIVNPVRIPDETTPIDTRVKVRSGPNNLWNERYFAFYSPKSENKFYTFECKKKSENNLTAVAWKYCEIIEDNN